MNTIVNLLDFKERGRGAPTLVLIDLHHELAGDIHSTDNAVASGAIANCRAALKHARASGIPVAFTRQAIAPTSMLASPTYPRWIEGFEPNRWDMVFDRQRPSCYASAEFQDMAEDIGGNYVAAGRYGETACLSTAIDAFHRDHCPTFLADALVSRPHEGFSAGALPAAVTSILSLYVEVARTQPWIIATARRVGVRV